MAYIFLGSQKHLMSDMFLNRKRPLYSSADHFPIGPIEVRHWRPLLRDKFEDSDRKIGTHVIEQICEFTQGHPFYTQHLCHAIWERCEPGREVTADNIRKGVQIVLAGKPAPTPRCGNLSLSTSVGSCEGWLLKIAMSLPTVPPSCKSTGLGTALQFSV